jgi:hypothetical protein
MSGRPRPESYTEDVPMGAPNKGKGRCVPEPTMDDTPMSMFSTVASKGQIDHYLEALGSNDEEWDSFEEEAQAEMAKPPPARLYKLCSQSLMDHFKILSLGAQRALKKKGGFQ